MEITPLCIQICINVFFLLSTQPSPSYTAQKPAFPIVSPDRLQFFEYKSVFISCGEDKEVNAWRVIRKLHNMSPTNASDGCSIPAPSCTIRHAFERDSGEYWCENDDGERSGALNISVTAGSVILNITAQPVTEGSDVIFRCINKNTKVTHISDFYKYGSHLKTHYKTDMTLLKVSKSDEGLYKCSISRAGQSPESWLAVVKYENEKDEGAEELQTSNNLPIILIILLCLTLMFMVIGLVLYKKHKALNNETASDPKETTYASINKPRKRKAGGKTADDVSDVTYAAVEIKQKGSKVSAATNRQCSSEQESVYSLITPKRGN